MVNSRGTSAIAWRFKCSVTRMRKPYLLVSTFFLLVGLAQADVSGKWSGTVDIDTPDGKASLPITAEFKQQDKALTGTIGKQGEPQYPIEKGALESGKMSFEFTAPDADEESGQQKFTLRLDVVQDNQIQGEFKSVNGVKLIGKVTLARAK